MIESGSADVTVFTDGSAEEGTRNGGHLDQRSLAVLGSSLRRVRPRGEK